MKRLSRISAAAFCIALIGLTAQSYLWAEDIKLHDLNGSVVDTGRIKAIDPPRRSSDGRFWVLTIYLESQAGPMAVKFQYPPENEKPARDDYKAIRKGKK